MLSAQESFGIAMEALNQGAYTYVLKDMNSLSIIKKSVTTLFCNTKAE